MSGHEPVLRVVRGNPTDEELAALVAVLWSRRGGEAAPVQPVSTVGWAARWRGIRAPLPPGPGAWRASGRPDS